MEDLDVTDSGQGSPALVFLHYFGGTSSSWNEVISELNSSFRCIAIDLFGFGKSPAPESFLSVEKSAEKVRKAIEEQNLTDYVLIGHSMGAKIAIALAAKPISGLRSLVLIAPSPPGPEPMSDAERQSMFEAWGKREAVTNMLSAAIGSSLSPRILQREIDNNLSVSEIAWHSWPELGSREDISSQMQYVHLPLCILYGEKDKRFTKTFLQKEYSRHFATFSLVEIKEAGHLVPVEKPQTVAEEIRKWLA